ncbi:MAG: hypothetical protein IKR27_04420, partial [Lachnospiraceae bacterium]|nr:hypothetical protein [Lachnospiraceae bacterium]
MKKSLKFLCFVLSVSILVSACGKTGSSSQSSADSAKESNDNSADSSVNSGTTPDSSSDSSSAEPSVPREKADASKIIYADSYSYEKLKADGVEVSEFSGTFEAETAAEADGVSLASTKAGFSGDGYLDINNNSNFEMKITVPSSQFYKVTVRHCAGDHKENSLLIGGSKAMYIVSEKGDWQETTVDGIFMEKGENTVTLGDGWSWFSLDYIKIENGN